MLQTQVGRAVMRKDGGLAGVGAHQKQLGAAAPSHYLGSWGALSWFEGGAGSAMPSDAAMPVAPALTYPTGGGKLPARTNHHG